MHRVIFALACGMLSARRRSKDGSSERFVALLARFAAEKGWTARELAAQLGVTDKAVSRWETGKAWPDISRSGR